MAHMTHMTHMTRRPHALAINFAPTGWRQLLALTPVWVLPCIVAAALLTAVAVAEANRIDSEREQLQVGIAKLRKPARQPTVSLPPVPEARALAINGVISQLNLPWSDLFDAVEQATPVTIALVGLEPDAKRNLLKGDAEALTSDDMIAYIERLKKMPQFVSVMLTKHAVDDQDQFKPLRFTFEAQWQEHAS